MLISISLVSNQIKTITVLVKVNLFNWAHLTGFLLQLAYSVKLSFIFSSTLLQRNPHSHAENTLSPRNAPYQTNPIHYIVFLFKRIIIVDGVWVFCLMKLPDVPLEITANGKTYRKVWKLKNYKKMFGRLFNKRKKEKRKKIKKI